MKMCKCLHGAWFHPMGGCDECQCKRFEERIRTQATHHKTPPKIHNSPYVPEAHADLCYCGFEQCERRKNRLEKERLERNQPERNAHFNMSIRKHEKKEGII